VSGPSAGLWENVMSKRGVIEQTPKAKCELCGKVAELRPYGPRGENICFTCGMKDEETTKRQFSGHVLGDSIQ
jgi:hypothetical protein